MAALIACQPLKALRESVLPRTSFQSIIFTQTEKRLVLLHSCLQLMDTIVTILTFLFIGNISLSYSSGKKHLLLTLAA